MNRPNIEAITARCEAATPGPWITHPYCENCERGHIYQERLEHERDGPHIYGSWHPVVIGCSTETDTDTYAFIAAARTDIPELIAYIAHLEARLENRELPEGVWFST